MNWEVQSPTRGSICVQELSCSGCFCLGKVICYMLSANHKLPSTHTPFLNLRCVCCMPWLHGLPIEIDWDWKQGGEL